MTIDDQLAPQQHRTGTDDAVAVAGVTVSFKGRGGSTVDVIKDLSFAVPKGTVMCLLGPNGSGKTTTVNLLTGLLRPSIGTVHVCGFEPARDLREVLRRIALVPQETALYVQLSARENLDFHANYYGVPKRAVRDRIGDMLAVVGLTDRADDRVSTFSGGMQRRLSLARAMLSEPDVLLLDEPTLGVDVHSRQAIWEHIQRLADEGRTVLLTTNHMEEAEAVGRDVLIIDKGRFICRGTPSELKSRIRGRRLELELDDEDSASAASHQLADFTATVNGRSIAVELPADTDDATVLRAVFGKLGPTSSVTGFRTTEPSLQDVFLAFTGRDLRD